MFLQERGYLLWTRPWWWREDADASETLLVRWKGSLQKVRWRLLWRKKISKTRSLQDSLGLVEETYAEGRMTIIMMKKDFKDRKPARLSWSSERDLCRRSGDHEQDFKDKTYLQGFPGLVEGTCEGVLMMMLILIMKMTMTIRMVAKIWRKELI